jgi:hypothetical protein
VSRPVPPALSEVPPGPSHRMTFDRAQEHLDAFNEAVGLWYDHSARVLVEKVEREISDAWWPRRRPPDPDEVCFSAFFHEDFPVAQNWALVFSDGIRGLRCSLDHLVHSLADAYSQSLTPEQEQGAEFPIFGDRAPSTKELEQRIGAVHPDAQTIIKGLQPHGLSNGYTESELWVLHELDNRLKRRTPPLVVTTSSDAGFINPKGVTWTEITAGPLEGDTVVARFCVVPGPDGIVRVNPDFAVDVTLGEGFPSVWDAVTTATRISDFIRAKVFDPLEPFLPRIS